MTKNKRKYNRVQLVSSVVMIIALLWLTISTPFVNAAFQQQLKHDNITNNCNPLTGTEEESGNPFGNNTEEKTPSTSFSEEYIHDHHFNGHYFSLDSRAYKCENAGVYTAFHGEVHVPPPNVA